MPRDLDDTFDWSGFNSSLLANDELDAQQLMKKEQLDYTGKTHDYDVFNALSGAFSQLSNVGGKAFSGGAGAFGGSAGAVAGRSTIGSGVPILDGISGIFGAIGAYKQKKEQQAELEKEQEDAEKMKATRASAASNQAYGMSLRNSGI